MVRMEGDMVHAAFDAEAVEVPLGFKHPPRKGFWTGAYGSSPLKQA